MMTDSDMKTKTKTGWETQGELEKGSEGLYSCVTFLKNE